MLSSKVFSALSVTAWLAIAMMVRGADLPADEDGPLPAAARRPVVVEREGPLPVPAAHDLPEGWSLSLAAKAPLVAHPIMGCVDDLGRLYVGDAVGVNWNREQLEKHLPNRILMLEDKDGDGTYDRSTVYADKMTFPQGAAWSDGSLYVCSPPGLWKLTDRDGDGVAEERTMLVSGFDYTGNAADVHGPKLHPDGRLYWCHGRKGHEVQGSDGHVVHEGNASGIWSCKPDGTDVQWHALGCADNPTGLAFTPEGDILGTCNLYYSQPRGDTLMHWLYGGVYERADQMQAIAGIPRTLEKMPVVHNFGHVAVSGCAFGRGSAAMSLFVTHFNTQRLVRMDLMPDGATFKTAENEFLKIHDPDVHLTDVITDRDGSLIVLNTGGWFRLGCPSSLMARPDLLGSIFRLRGPGPGVSPAAAKWKSWWELAGKDQILEQLRSPQPRAVLHALSAAARHEPDRELAAALKDMMERPLEPVLEHAFLTALRRSDLLAVRLEDIRSATNPLALRRMLTAFVPDDAAAMNLHMGQAAKHLDAEDADLGRVSLGIVCAHADADEWVTPRLEAWLKEDAVTPRRLEALEGYVVALVEKPGARGLLGRMLADRQAPVRQAALRILAARALAEAPESWVKNLEPQAGDDHLPLLLAALKRMKDHPFDDRLQALAGDAELPLTVRLKALDAMKGGRVDEGGFALLTGVLADMQATAAARIQAATMLGAASLNEPQVRALAGAFATAGPVELKELLAIIRRQKEPATGRLIAVELAKNPALLSQQESTFRTVFSHLPPEVFEETVLPARQRLEKLMDAKKRQLGMLADQAAAQGNAEAGKAHFAQGKGTCIACHKIGDAGRAIGPDLSRIGGIRTERDLLESILFPSNTLARDYEAHMFELKGGETAMGVVRSHAAEGLLVLDVAGQERLLRHDHILSDTVLHTSLMPMGLDATMTEQELLDLVAYLRSLK